MSGAKKLGRARAIAAIAAVCLLSACSNSYKPTVAALLGLGVTIEDPGPDGVRVNKGGVFANYFPNKELRRAPGILLLGGSEGGLSPGADEEARNLTAAGFSVLYLCYFGCPGTPSQLVSVPLETFDRGLAFLRAEPGIDRENIAVLGESKGAEAALLVAARDPNLKAVVAAMPSSVAWPGIKLTLGSPPGWTTGNVPVPYLHYTFGSFFKEGMIGIYTGALPNIARHPDSVIPVERITAPILLICGERDILWPSCPMADQISARLKTHGRVTPLLLRYKDAGHKVFGAPLEKADPNFAELASLGGTLEGNASSRADSWTKTIAFLSRTLESAR